MSAPLFEYLNQTVPTAAAVAAEVSWGAAYSIATEQVGLCLYIQAPPSSYILPTTDICLDSVTEEQALLVGGLLCHR